jgi:hypothetical protein
MNPPRLVFREGIWCARVAITETYTVERLPSAARRRGRAPVRTKQQERLTSHYEVPLWTSDRATAEERLYVLLGRKAGPLPDVYAQAMRSFYLRNSSGK